MLTMTMDQEEIENALTESLQAQMPGLDLSERQIVIILKAGRQGNGHTAKLEISPVESPVVTAENDAVSPAAAEEEQAVGSIFDEDSEVESVED